MGRSKNASLVAFLRSNPEMHQALRDAEWVKPPKAKPLSERIRLARKYGYTSKAKQCRKKHAAWVWREKAPKSSGSEYFCTRCVWHYKRRAALEAARQAKAAAEGRIVTPHE